MSVWPHSIQDHHNRPLQTDFLSPFVRRWLLRSSGLEKRSAQMSQHPSSTTFLLVLFSQCCRGLGTRGFFRDGWNFGGFCSAAGPPRGVWGVWADWSWILKLGRVRGIAATATAGSAACLAACPTGGTADSGSSSLWVWQNKEKHFEWVFITKTLDALGKKK